MLEKSVVTNSIAIFEALSSYGISGALSALCLFEKVENIEKLAEKASITVEKIAAIQHEWQFLEMVHHHFPHVMQNHIFHIEKECGF